MCIVDEKQEQQVRPVTYHWINISKGTCATICDSFRVPVPVGGIPPCSEHIWKLHLFSKSRKLSDLGQFKFQVKLFQLSLQATLPATKKTCPSLPRLWFASVAPPRGFENGHRACCSLRYPPTPAAQGGARKGKGFSDTTTTTTIFWHNYYYNYNYNNNNYYYYSTSSRQQTAAGSSRHQ